MLPLHRSSAFCSLRRFSTQISTSSSTNVADSLLATANLKSGDVLVQNEADSDLGQAIIKQAKKQGIKTINVIADKPNTPLVVEKLKLMGGDIVVSEAYTNTWFIKRLVSDFPKPTLALNCSDGYGATAVVKLLQEGGTLLTHGKKLPQNVVYPGAERRPVEWNQYLKAKNLKSEIV